MQDLESKVISLAICCGDPSGIGPEIALEATYRAQQAYAKDKNPVKFILCGPSAVWERAAAVLSSRMQIALADLDCVYTAKNVAVLPDYGHATALGGQIALSALDDAILLAKSLQVQAIVTAPVCKHSLYQAGVQVPGQTEYLAQAFLVPRALMMLCDTHLRVILHTIHIPLRRVFDYLSPNMILETLQLADRYLSPLLKLAHARLALCALNPHAGEQGQLGDEEICYLSPALTLAQEQGLLASGPYPADTVFYEAQKGRFDAVIALYHDQAAIALKTNHLDSGVNMTLGLPVIRTSPDHGTAFDLAGTGRARMASMQQAIHFAVRAAQGRFLKED